jgi:hypothetical protein
MNMKQDGLSSNEIFESRLEKIWHDSDPGYQQRLKEKLEELNKLREANKKNELLNTIKHE